MNCISIYDTKRLPLFAKTLRELFLDSEPVFLCIGNPSIPSECIAPKVGTLISALPLKVYGCDNRPLTSPILPEVMDFVSKMHPPATPLLISSAIGNDVGCIKLLTDSDNLLPNTSMNLPPLCTLRIAIVNPFNEQSAFVPNALLTSTATAQANLIANTIAYAFF